MPDSLRETVQQSLEAALEAEGRILARGTRNRAYEAINALAVDLTALTI
jgi:hypothetical protein